MFTNLNPPPYAPAASKLIVQTASPHLPDEQSLGALTTGLLLNTVTGSTGVLSKAVADTDYIAASAKLAALRDATWAANKTFQLSGTSTVSIIDLLYSTYTPTLFNTTNVAASTAAVCGYLRVGSGVLVWGNVQIDPTAAGPTATVLGMSIPIASNFTDSAQLGGVAAGNTVGIDYQPVRIIGDSTNDRATFQFNATDLANRTFGFNFAYEVL